MLMSAATSAWLIYEMASATEAPSRAVAVLQYSLLACALSGLIGSLMKYAAEKRAATGAPRRSGSITLDDPENSNRV
jgi:hypothetical protein